MRRYYPNDELDGMARRAVTDWISRGDLPPNALLTGWGIRTLETGSVALVAKVSYSLPQGTTVANLTCDIKIELGAEANDRRELCPRMRSGQEVSTKKGGES